MSYTREQEAWLERREEVADGFVRCLGGRPDWGALDSKVVCRSETEEHVAEWVTLTAEPGETVTGLLLMPKGISGPYPVIVAHHGFYGNKEQLLLGEDPDAPGSGNVPLAQMTRLGMAVMAIDGRAHGQRGSPELVLPWRIRGENSRPRPNRVEDWQGYKHAIWEDFDWRNRQALIDGSSIGALETWDAVRLLDFLETRPEIDMGRVGTFGHSRGGDIAWYLALADDRVKAVCTSGCMMTFEACLKFRRDAGMHAWIPGIRRHASREELVSSLAPRPLLAMEGEDDHPREAEQPIRDAACRAYGLMAVPERFAFEHWPGGHGEFLRDPAGLRRIGEWFKRWL